MLKSLAAAQLGPEQKSMMVLLSIAYIPTQNPTGLRPASCCRTRIPSSCDWGLSTLLNRQIIMRMVPNLRKPTQT